MNAIRGMETFSRFTDTLVNLERTLTLPGEDEDYRNSAILAFMLAEEAMWKALKTLLEWKVGVEVSGPKPVLQEAFKQGWLGQDDGLWLAMVDDRNRIVHIYNKVIAKGIYENLSYYAPRLRVLHDMLRRTYRL